MKSIRIITVIGNSLFFSKSPCTRNRSSGTPNEITEQMEQAELSEAKEAKEFKKVR